MKITKDQIEEYLDLKQQKQALDRESRSLESKLNALGKHFSQAVEKAGKPINRQGYRLAFELVNGRVSWKDAFIEELGPLAAAKRQEDCPKKNKLIVEKAA